MRDGRDSVEGVATFGSWDEEDENVEENEEGSHE